MILATIMFLKSHPNQEFLSCRITRRYHNPRGSRTVRSITGVSSVFGTPIRGAIPTRGVTIFKGGGVERCGENVLVCLKRRPLGA